MEKRQLTIEEYVCKEYVSKDQHTERAIHTYLGFQQIEIDHSTIKENLKTAFFTPREHI